MRDFSVYAVMFVGLVVTLFASGCGGSGGGDTSGGSGGGGGGDTGPSWTVMVYLDGDNNLEEAALADFNEMEAARTNLNTKIVVLFDRSSAYSRAQGDWGETRLYEIRHDTDTSVIVSKRLTDPSGLGLYGDEADELNMGSGETLKRFVAFCKEGYPSDHTALILWDHGSGWAPASADTPDSDTKFIAIDDGSAGDALSMKEVAAALAGQEVDLLGFDACLMAEAEVAWELRDSARYMVASEGLESADGWDYTDFLSRFSSLPESEKTPESLAHCIVESYVDGTPLGSERTLAAVDLAGLFPLGEAVDALAAEVKELGPDVVTTARYHAVNYNENTCVDLRQFAEALEASEEVRTALDAALAQAVLVNGATRPETSCGLSLYFPVFGYSSVQYAEYSSSNLAFVQGTRWRDALDDYLSRTPAYTMETVPGDADVDTVLSLYTEDLTFVAENDDKSASSRFSRLDLPVARGATYYLRVASPGGFWFDSPAGSYGIGAGPFKGWETSLVSSVTPVTDADDTYDGRPAQASPLPVNTPQAHYLSKGDEDWFRFTVPE